MAHARTTAAACFNEAADLSPRIDQDQDQDQDQDGELQ